MYPMCMDSTGMGRGMKVRCPESGQQALVLYDPDRKFCTEMAPFVHQFCTGIGRRFFVQQAGFDQIKITSHIRVSRWALHILWTRFDISNTANSYLGM